MLCKTHKSNCPIWGKLTLLGVVIFVVATLPFIMSISRMKSLVLWKSFAVFNYSLSHLHHTMFHLQERKPALSWRCSQGFLTPFKMLCHLWQNLAWWPKGIRNRRVWGRDPCVKVPMALLIRDQHRWRGEVSVCSFSLLYYIGQYSPNDAQLSGLLKRSL